MAFAPNSRRCEHRRRRTAPSMEIRLQESGLVGTFRTPEGSGPFPGFWRFVALTAEHRSLPEALCGDSASWPWRIEKSASTPATMVEKPSERIDVAFVWLLGRADVSAETVVGLLIGISTRWKLVAAGVDIPDLVGPSARPRRQRRVVGLDFAQPPGPARSTSSYRGASRFRLSISADVVARLALNEASPCCPTLPRQHYDDHDAVERATIAAERAHGPLMLVSGGDDRVSATGECAG